MKKAVLTTALLLMVPVLTLAQSRWSVSPAIGFYKAELDALSEDLDLLETFGAKVEKPNGSLHFGGRLHYEKTPNWSWLAEASIWKDKAAGNIQDQAASLDFEDQVRLVPIMVGSQYFFSQPGAQARFYAGATGGLVLVNVETQINIVAPGAAPYSETSSASGRDFIGKPFIGLEIANSSKMSFWGELGYMFGKYSIEATDLATGVKVESNVSLNGLHVTGGVKIQL